MKKALLFIALIILSLIFSLPYLASTVYGKNLILEQLNRKLHSRLSVETVSLSWLGPQTFIGIELVEPSGVSFTIKKATIEAPLWDIFKKTPHIGVLTITNPQGTIVEQPKATTVKEAVSSAVQAKEKKTMQHPLFVGTIIIENGNLAFSIPKGDQVTLKDWNARLSLDEELKTMHLDIQGLAAFEQIEGKVQATGNIKNLLSLTPALEMDILLTNFPVAPFDDILSTFYPKAQDLLTLGVGPTINLNAVIKESQCSCVINSDKITVDFLAKEKNKTIVLDRMATIAFDASPEFLRAFAKTLSLEIASMSPLHLQLEVAKFEVPIANSAFIIKDAAFACHYTITNAGVIEGVLNTESLEKNLTFTAQSAHFSLQGIAENLLEKVPVYRGELKLQNAEYQANHFDGTVLFSFDQDLKISNSHLVVQGTSPFYFKDIAIYAPIKADIKSATIPFPFNANFILDGVFTIARINSFENITVRAKAENSSQIVLDILPIQLKKQYLSPYLAKNFPLFLLQNDIEAKIQVSDLDLKKQTGLASVTFSNAQFINAKTQETLLVQDCSAKIVASTPLEITLYGRVGAMELNSKAFLTKADNTALTPYIGLLKTSFTGLDPLLLSRWIVDEPLFSVFSGPLSGSINITANPHGVTFDTKVDSYANHVVANCLWDGHTITLNDTNTPLYFDLLITKENFLDNKLYLTQDSKAIFQISELSIPYSRLDTFTFEKRIKESSFLLSLALDPLALKNQENQTLIQAQNTLLRLGRKDLASPFSFSGVSSFVTKKGDSAINVRNGELKWQATLQLELTEQKAIDIRRSSIDIDAKLAHMPAEFAELGLRLFTNNPPVMAELFGEMISCQMKAKINDLTGPLSLQLYSPYAQAYLLADLQQGTLTLADDMEAQFYLSAELSKLLLNLAPQSAISQIMAKSPISLEVKSKGFSWPLYPMTLTTFSAPNIHLELGQIVCKNEGNLKTALGFLKNQKLMSNTRLELWFAPVDCHIQQGQVELERTEILLENLYQVCLWGNFDLVQKYADLTLGLTASCLQAALGVRGLPRDYVLKIPVNGPFSNIEVDKSTAMTKIAALLVWQQKDTLGSLGGKFGGFLGQAAGAVLLPDNFDKAPPAKRPFPWESSHNETKPEKKKPSKAFSFLISSDDKKPLKQIFKLLF